MLRAPRCWLPLLAIACVSLLCAGCRRGDDDQNKSFGVARVNGTPIPLDAFEDELAFARRTSGGVVPQAPDELLAFKRAVLDEMIDRALVLAAARESGVSVAADEIDREILKLKAEYHGAGFDEALAEGQLSQQELRERTRARLLEERYFADEVFSRIVVTDPEIEAYYKEHADELAQPEQVRAAQIVVHTLDEAKRVQSELKQGMSFEEAARRFSLSPDARLGGDLGFFKRGVMPEVFDKVCFGLQAGKVSEIVPSDYGFHLFKLLDRRPAGKRSLEQAKTEIERRLLRAGQEAAQKRRLEELRQGANVEIDEAQLAKVTF